MYPLDIKKEHEEIQKKIFLMLPEKWDSLFLYASVIEHPSNLQVGEMFFYYFPKGLLRKNPVNVYEVPSKFNIDENQYFRLADDLYDNIKKLKKMQIEYGEESWSNITIIIEKLKYKVIYNYEDLSDKKFNSGDRRIIWRYKYLKFPYESFNRREREIIDTYRKEPKQEESIFELPIYTKKLNKDIESIKTIEKKLEFVTEDTIQEMEFKSKHVPKSQILKM